MQVAVARHQTRCGTLGKSSVKACWLCGLELCALETSVPPLPPAPCSQVDAIREANAPGALGGEAGGFSSWGAGLGNSSFSEHCSPSCPLSAISLLFQEKKFEVEWVPRWNIFQMSVQSVVHYS